MLVSVKMIVDVSEKLVMFFCTFLKTVLSFFPHFSSSHATCMMQVATDNNRNYLNMLLHGTWVYLSNETFLVFEAIPLITAAHIRYLLFSVVHLVDTRIFGYLTYLCVNNNTAISTAT